MVSGAGGDKAADPKSSKWGLPWTPDQFVKAAVAAGHPFASLDLLPSELTEALEAHLVGDWDEIRRDRFEWCARRFSDWKSLLKLEAESRKGLDPEVARVIKDKKLLLWEDMLKEAGHPDTALPAIFLQGFELTGDVQASGVFRPAFEPATLCEDDLLAMAPEANLATIQSTRSSGKPNIDRGVWEKTMEEVDKGWLRGPLQASSVHASGVVTRRFGVEQGVDEKGPKVRPIDDFSASLINSTVSTEEKISLHTLDVRGAVIACWMQQACSRLEDARLVGRAYDLKAAYRQLPLSAGARRFAFVSVFNPHETNAAVFGLSCLPFGAIASVHHFLRSAAALWRILVKCGRLLTTSYFDDFPLVTPPALEESCASFIQMVFRLTGWLFATEGKQGRGLCPGVLCPWS